MFLQRLDRLREKKLLSKAEVYDLIGISQAMVSMIRSGKRQPSAKLQRRLEAAEREAGLIEQKEEAPIPQERPPPKNVYPEESSSINMVREEISNHWKKEDENFQSLETRIERLESMLEMVLEAINSLKQ
jgi:transcriptional regulator with XRE-family HTH domain